MTGLCLLASCNRQEADQEPQMTVLTASGASTRVAIDESTATTCTWSEGDALSVFTTEGAFKEFTLIDGAGENTGTFGAVLADGESAQGYAVSPAGDHKYSDGTLKINLPATYEYKTGVSNIPMVASANGTDNLKFSHAGGVIRFAIKNVTVGGTFEFICNTARVTGDFDVAFSDGKPVISADDASASSTVTLTFDKPEVTGEDVITYFYIPVPTGTYSNFTINIYNADDNALVMTKTAASEKNIVGRGTVLKMKTLTQPTFSGGTE